MSNDTTIAVCSTEHTDAVALEVVNELPKLVKELTPPYLERIRYVSGSKPLYWIFNRFEEKWLQMDENSTKRWLVNDYGLSSSKSTDEVQSQVNKALCTIQEQRHVDWVGEIGGYVCGHHEMGSLSILVPTGVKLMKSNSGNYPLILRILQSMFVEEHGADQYVLALCWLARSLQALYKGEKNQGQALVLVGPANSMKSFSVNHIFAKLFGGRVGKPLEHMLGMTRFNNDIIGSELLLLDDEVYSTSENNRRKVGSSIKKFTANEGIRCETKFKDSLVLNPFQRTIILLNDEPENVSVLPPMDESIKDKLIILKVNQCSAPMPTDTDEERAAFRKAIYAELPAFLDFLLSMDIPSELRHGRFGIKAFHHPDVLGILNGFQTEVKVLKLVLEALRPSSGLVSCLPSGVSLVEGCYKGKAADLESFVRSRLSQSYYREFEKLNHFSTAFGVNLEKISKLHPNVVSRLPARAGWSINKTELLALPEL